jgi:hypothetical protein
MSERENFLARWSRRKHAAAGEPNDAEFPAMLVPVEGRKPAEETAVGERPRANDVASAARGPDAIAPLFSPATLPPIESIAADTDIRAFLAAGVPPELARAALRRAWATDPKIRDFVGLADYDWDFNAPGSMAGFGPLEMTEDLRQIAARIIEPPHVAESMGVAGSSAPLGQASSRDESPPAGIVQDMTEEAAESSGGNLSSERDSSMPQREIGWMRPKSHNLFCGHVTEGP